MRESNNLSSNNSRTSYLPWKKKSHEPAIEWISNNLRRNLRKVEVYKRLCEEELIDPKTHILPNLLLGIEIRFSAVQYVMNASNQLLSSLNFLKQPELISEGYKVVLYLENDFVQALGFLTPFNTYISRDNIHEFGYWFNIENNSGKIWALCCIDHCGRCICWYFHCLQDPRNRINSKNSHRILFSIDDWGHLTNIHSCQ